MAIKSIENEWLNLKAVIRKCLTVPSSKFIESLIAKYCYFCPNELDLRGCIASKLADLLPQNQFEIL